MFIRQVIKIIMAFQADTWKDYYDGYHLKDPFNMKMADIIKSLPATLTKVESFDALKMIQGVALLGVNGFNEIIVLHNVTILGPDLLHPVTKIIALMGAELLAEGVKLHTAIFDEDSIDLPCPKWNDLKQATDKDDIAKLTPPDTNIPCLKSKHLLPVPPIIWNMILRANSSDAVVLVPVLSAAMQEFDKKSLTIKACEIL